MFDSDPTLKYQSLWHGIAYAMLVVIFIASLLPPEHVQAPGSDKLHHLLSYAVLAWWCVLAFQISSFKGLSKLALKLIFFSGMIEILQGLSGYRYAEWADLLANSMGVVLGSLMAFYLMRNFLLRIEKLF